MSTTSANPDVRIDFETGEPYLRNQECQLRFRVTNETDVPRDVSLQVVLLGSKDKLEQYDTEAEQYRRLCDRGHQVILSYAFLPRIAGKFALKSWRLVVSPIDDPAQSRVYELSGQDLAVRVTTPRKGTPAPNVSFGAIHVETRGGDVADPQSNVTFNLPAGRLHDDEPQLSEWQALRVRFAGIEKRIACGFAECSRPLPSRGNFTCARCKKPMCRDHQENTENARHCQLCAEQIQNEEEFDECIQKVPHRAEPEQTAKALDKIVQKRPAFEGRIWTSHSANAKTRDLQCVARTSKNSYTIGEEFTLNVQAQRDCYVTILDLGTSGNLFVLLKNYRLQANVPQSLSGPDEQYGWRVGGPTGVERMKAMFTAQPLNIFPGAECFTLLNLMGQADALEKISALYTSLNTLAPDSWTDAACEFVVQESS
jgi:hypothetical protein